MLIGELAKISGMSKDGIRHYEEIGLISSISRKAGSRWYKDYDAGALDIIEKVRQAQRLGFSLREIEPLIRAHLERPMSEPEAIIFLEERLRVVRGKIVELREVEEFVVRKLQGYKAKQQPVC